VAEQTIGGALADAVARWAGREAFTFADRRMTFREVDAESDDVARALLGFGIKRGDRVAVWMVNHSAYAALYFGVMKIGAVLVPLNTRLRPDELAFGLQKAGATMLFFKREQKGRTDFGDVLHETLPELATAQPGDLHAASNPQLRTVIDVADPPAAGTLSYGAFLERATGVTQ
jgi:fatty-acyl-CoA synthase